MGRTNSKYLFKLWACWACAKARTAGKENSRLTRCNARTSRHMRIQLEAIAIRLEAEDT